MMKQMGWHGGPLGLRGEGITEPIVPALHLAPGAGLGHVKPENKSKITDSFRHEFSRELLYLLKQDQQKRTIEFRTPITNSQKKYIINTIQLSNERNEISQECEEAAAAVVIEIMEELLCEPDVCVSCAFSPDKRKLVLTKYMKPIPNPPIPKQPKTLPTDKDKEVKQKCTVLPKVITAKSAKNIGKLYSATSSRAGKLGLYIILQYKLLEFLKSDLPEYAINFDFVLSKKVVAFAKFVVQGVNARGTPVCQTTVEYDLGMEMLKHAKNKKISVECGQRSIVFRNVHSKIEPKELGDFENNNNSITVNNNKQVASILEEELDEASNGDIQNVIGKDSKVTGNVENCVDDWNEIGSDDSFRIKEEINEKTTTNEIMSKDVSFDEETKQKQDTKNIHEDITVNGQEIPNANTNTVYSKRARSDSDESSKIMKKTKINKCVTYLFLTPKDTDDISNDQLKKFQSALSDQIDATVNRPLLECHGVENGALIYGCHNEVGVTLVKSLASGMEFTVKENEIYREKSNLKMKVMVNSFFGINLKKFFNTIECYNEGLSTESWAVLDVEVSRGQIVLLLEIDHVSFQHISDNNFRLFAGIDRLRFCIAWD